MIKTIELISLCFGIAGIIFNLFKALHLLEMPVYTHNQNYKLETAFKGLMGSIAVTVIVAIILIST